MEIFLSDLYPNDPGPSGATGPQGATGPIPANVVFTTGNQTISGIKTFRDAIILKNASMGVPTYLTDADGLQFKTMGGNNYDAAIYGTYNGYQKIGISFNITGEPNLTDAVEFSPFKTVSNVQLFAPNLVYNTGDQTISGLKDFTTRPTVNTIPVALSGEAASSIEQWVKNDSNTTLYKGQPVYVSGSNGNNILIYSASNTGERTSSKTFGLLKQTLLNNEQGYVVTEGSLSNVDTSMATEGDPVWLGPTGNLIFGLVNKPKAPQHLVSLGFVERAHQNQGKIFVKVQNGFELEELHNVRIVNEQNSDIIIYNSGSGLWLNSGVNFGSYYTNNNPSGFISNQGVVFTTGNQTINGVKNFTGIDNFLSRGLQYNGTGVMIDGDAIPVQKYIQVLPFNTGTYNPYYIISGAAYLSASSLTDTNGNILLPQDPKNNTICEITVPSLNAGLSLNIFTVPASYPSNPFAFVSGGNGSAGYIKLSYIDGEWRKYPAVTPHRSTHSSYGADPIFAKDVLAVPELSNYYTNKLDADVSVGGSGIYETNSQLNGKSYWTSPVGDPLPGFGIRWNNINNSWQIGIHPGFSIIFAQSFHDVPEPYMATGWQNGAYGAQFRSIRRLPYVDITNQQIQGSLLIDNIFTNTGEIKSSPYHIFSNNNFTIGSQNDRVLNIANSTSGITGYLPEVVDGRMYKIKNINVGTVILTGSNLFQNNSLSWQVDQNGYVDFLGIRTAGYTGWVTI